MILLGLGTGLGVWAQDEPNIPTENNPKNEIPQEMLEAHPLYQYIKAKKEEEWYRRILFGYGFNVIQMDSNTPFPTRVGTGNYVPAVSLIGEFWPLRNWGVRARWIKAAVIFFPNNDPQNDAFKTIDFATPDIVFRYYFQATSQASYLQFGLGLHWFHFPLVVDNAIPWVTENYGLAFSVERKLAFNNRTGIRGNIDVYPMLAAKPVQEIWISKNLGVGIHFSVELYHTMFSEEGMETIVSLIYGQYDYIYKTSSIFQNSQNRGQYNQTFRSLALQFAARL